MVNGKRKSMADPVDDADKRRKKAPVKKQPAFKPQPIPNSSDTPPDEGDNDESPMPPPPSERKIARRRESTRAIRERQQSLSPTPGTAQLGSGSVNTAKKQRSASGASRAGSRGRSMEPIRAAANTADDPMEGVEETASMRTAPRAAPKVDGLHVPASRKQASSAPRPTSPPRRTFAPKVVPSAASKAPMGPPTGFVRKTRQSMSAHGEAGRYDLSKESVVPVMESETPVIRKNQELRGQQARRSSLDHRGSRASSSWGRGEITMPHKSVDSKLFYRHIPLSYPEPIKARMLLVWCANRAVDEAIKNATRRADPRRKGKEVAKREEGTTEEGDRMIRDIMDEFVRDMNGGAVDTSVFGLPGQDTSTPGLKPHPRNVANRKVQAEANAEIRKFKDEKSQWSSLSYAMHTKQQEVLKALSKKKAQDVMPDMSTAESWMQDALKLAEEVIAEGDGDLGEVGDFDDVEYKVDTLHQKSHVALQYTLQSTRFLDGIFSSLTADLRVRDGLDTGLGLPPALNDDGPDLAAVLANARASSSTSSLADTKGKKKDDTMSLLRALAATESKAQSEQTVERAMAVRPVQAGLGLGSSTIGSATPRRGAATPRGKGRATPGRRAVEQASE